MTNNQQQEQERNILDNEQIEKYKKMRKNDLLNEVIALEKKLEEKEAYLHKIEEELKSLRENEKHYKEQLIRMQADFENYKKREEKKKQEFIEYAKEDLICKLLSVMDNLERASSYTEEQRDEKHYEDIKEGIKNILKDFRNILEKEGLKPIKAMGEKFDPYCHEAIMQVESDQYPEDTITEELIKGYYLKSKVIRPSVVKVSKGRGEKRKEEIDKYKTEKTKEDNDNNK
jgi:molecular chaperone GrpE